MSGATLRFRFGSGQLRRQVMAVLVACFWLMPTASWSEEGAIDADAAAILLSMTNYLKGLKTFSFDFDSDSEIINTSGQKIQFGASGSVSVARPDKLRIERNGPSSDAQIIFDGKTVSLYSKNLNVYAQIQSPGPTIDDAVEEFRVSTGLDAPGADLFAADPYAVLTETVQEGAVVGTAYVAGVECNHLAFRNTEVDWQIWIRKGDQPLPMKYVITTKWVTGAPQHTIRFSNWNVAATFDPALFSFTPPAGARKVEQVSSDEIGDIVLEDAE